MADVDAVAFATRISHACQASRFVRSYDVTIQDNLLVKVRADLLPGAFIDVFYNAQTGKTSFALIESNVRVYGADNTTRWHIHPFENPNSHQPSEPVSFETFLQTIASWLERKG
ncbi:MAG: hypothetical protein HY770_07815 [Chitinivibrionia bacterium]|nr:hypothetical protein [Chitinivibrionia bacterium]MBI4787219.1 hypothetical protein [Chloroflexota bacterium]